jgi:hypothetical protein
MKKAVMNRAVICTRRSVSALILAARLVPAQSAELAVEMTGAVKQLLALCAGDLTEMPRASVRMSHNGTDTVYEGVWIHVILKAAGVPQGSALRGKAESRSPALKTDSAW